MAFHELSSNNPNYSDKYSHKSLKDETLLSQFNCSQEGLELFSNFNYKSKWRCSHFIHEEKLRENTINNGAR